MRLQQREQRPREEHWRPVSTKDVERFFNSRKTESTRQNYLKWCGHIFKAKPPALFQTLADFLNQDRFASEDFLIDWITNNRERVKPRTIKDYLAAITSCSRVCDVYHNWSKINDVRPLIGPIERKAAPIEAIRKIYAKGDFRMKFIVSFFRSSGRVGVFDYLKLGDIRRKVVDGVEIEVAAHEQSSKGPFYYMAHQYAKRIRRGGRSFFGMKGKKRRSGDNPKIKHSHQEHKEINLNQEYEVRHAEEVGAIKIGKRGAISPVPGKSYIRNGHLFYTENKYHVEEHVVHAHRKEHHESARKITEEDRKKWDSNAKKGSEKWHLMPHAERVERRRNPKGQWGFEGQSPNTKNRR